MDWFVTTHLILLHVATEQHRPQSGRLQDMGRRPAASLLVAGAQLWRTRWHGVVQSVIDNAINE